METAKDVLVVVISCFAVCGSVLDASIQRLVCSMINHARHVIVAWQTAALLQHFQQCISPVCSTYLLTLPRSAHTCCAFNQSKLELLGADLTRPLYTVKLSAVQNDLPSHGPKP